MELWRDFPRLVRDACGGPETLVWSRLGYGRSSVVRTPRHATYMHDEALVYLPELLERTGICRPVLIGHSDGGSIAAIHAGAGHPVAALVLIAPHVFVEERSIAGIQEARVAFETAGLRERLERYHDDVDATFWGWNNVWLSPEFRNWNIEGTLSGITAPTLVIQGDADQYGTLAQLDTIEAASGGVVQRVVLAGGRHFPHVDHRDETVAAVSRFVRSVV
ncbi:MAG: hypothetical protein NVSMB4_18640 [Acidimicrobiales bacterium]